MTPEQMEALAKLAARAELGQLAPARRFVAQASADQARASEASKSAPKKAEGPMPVAPTAVVSPLAPAASVSAPAPAPAPAFRSPAPTPSPQPAPAPQLTLSQYASLCAELALTPAAADAIFRRHGLESAQQRAATDAAWKERLRRDPAEYQTWQDLYQRWYAHWAARRAPTG